ncbi:MAG: hypothetical protein KC503_18015 [Myxococcales bacterium]|nr:hypothetical protein [Myxococcales bacterium]
MFPCPLERTALIRQLDEPRDLYVIDADDDPDHIRWLLKQLYARGDKREISSLLVSYEVESPLLLELLRGEGLNHLIARHGGLTASQELIDEAELIVTCQKLVRKDIFGLDKYISTWGVKVHEQVLTRAEQKHDALTQLDAFLHRLDCHGSIVPAISLVADELLMNAIFNAPRDEAGKGKYVDIDRAQPLALDDHEHVTFRYACDGRYVALSVSDNFGSLDRDVIMRYLERCFLGSQGVIEEKRAGAGLGLFMVFNSITQLSFNIDQGKRTEVIALFYVRGGARAFKLSGRSLNIFMLRNEETE